MAQKNKTFFFNPCHTPSLFLPPHTSLSLQLLTSPGCLLARLLNSTSICQVNCTSRGVESVLNQNRVRSDNHASSEWKKRPCFWRPPLLRRSVWCVLQCDACSWCCTSFLTWVMHKTSPEGCTSCSAQHVSLGLSCLLHPDVSIIQKSRIIIHTNLRGQS